MVSEAGEPVGGTEARERSGFAPYLWLVISVAALASISYGAGDRILRQLVELGDSPTAPVLGAVVLFSDGGDNSGSVGANAISALRARRIPVHTVGFGRERVQRDVELDEAAIAPRALAGSRLAAKISFHQRGFAGARINLTVRDLSSSQGKVLAARSVALGP